MLKSNDLPRQHWEGRAGGKRRERGTKSQREEREGQSGTEKGVHGTLSSGGKALFEY